jgi:SpoVK/Ycf46/Vps4 family AAA+-type ATPase
MSSYLGRTGTNVRYVLDYAKSCDSVLLLDEFDAIAKRRNDDSEIGELKRLVTVLLQEIDTWPDSHLLLAATNHPELLDRAVWRRFGTVIEFPLPTPEDTQSAVNLYLADSLGLDSNWKRVMSTLLKNESFSEIERCCSQVRKDAILLQMPLDQSIRRLAESRASELSAEERRELAARLYDAGVPQRSASELTGVARETIRNRARSAMPTKGGSISG